MFISLRIFLQTVIKGRFRGGPLVRVFPLCIRIGQEAVFVVFSFAVVSRLKDMKGKEGLFDIKR